jgi:midasin (ATPase involved in ribosome maturation)
METVMNLAASTASAYVPVKEKNFVPFGSYKDIKQIIGSDMFYPIFITGLSGNGKTVMIHQACAENKKELIRVNITIETDEEDLIGGFRLINGETVWQDGPVIIAMKRGAKLLLDEVDLGSNKLLCLQPVLEGKGIFVKKINQFIMPQVGFNIFATANTKGKGSEDGRFIGTNILNEAFLERFAATFEHDVNIVPPENFVKNLVNWADVIRRSFAEDAVDEVISTRRLLHIANAYAIFKNKEKAINLCINRFDMETKSAFLELYSKVDENFKFDGVSVLSLPDSDEE